jgi:hypothetical protein
VRILVSTFLVTVFGLPTAAEGQGVLGPSTGPIEISGNLPARLQNRGVPYLVTADIMVPPGETVEIDPGTVLLFRGFTGLLVHGVLIAKGERGRPIFFTSENDTAYVPSRTQVPAPYDWNGITVYENAEGTTLEYCMIAYTLFGLNALTDQIIIRSCKFHDNGKSDLQLAGTPLRAGGKPYTNELGMRPGPFVPRESAAEAERARRTRVWTILRIGGAAVALAGLAAAVYQTREYVSSNRDLESLSTVSDAHKRDPRIIEKWDRAKENRDRDGALMLVSYGGSLAGCVVLTLSFFF